MKPNVACDVVSKTIMLITNALINKCSTNTLVAHHISTSVKFSVNCTDQRSIFTF